MLHQGALLDQSHRDVEVAKQRNQESLEDYEANLSLFCNKHRNFSLNHICIKCLTMVCKECLKTEHICHASMSIRKLFSDSSRNFDAKVELSDAQKLLTATELVDDLINDEAKLETRITDRSDVDKDILQSCSIRDQVLPIPLSSKLDYISSTVDEPKFQENAIVKSMLSNQEIQNTTDVRANTLQMIRQIINQNRELFIRYLSCWLWMPRTKLSPTTKKKRSLELHAIGDTPGDEKETNPSQLSAWNRIKLLEAIDAYRTQSSYSLDFSDVSIRKSEVIIRCVVKQGAECTEEDVDELRRAVAPYLNGILIKISILAEKPKFELTASGLGSRLAKLDYLMFGILRRLGCCVGAFLHVRGEGDHILTAGHSVDEGQSVWFGADSYLTAIQKGKLGNVVARLVELNNERKSVDAALIKLCRPIESLSRTVQLATTSAILSNRMNVGEEHQTVVKVCDQSPVLRGIITETDYNNFDNNLYGCISIKAAGEAQFFHEDGESGKMVAYESVESLDQGCTTLTSVGTLIGRYQDTDGVWRSVAIPISRNLESLSSHEYVAGSRIDIIPSPLYEGSSVDND